MSYKFFGYMFFYFFPLMGHAMEKELDNKENKDSRVYVIIGYPGAGKGTFAQSLKPQGYTHLSSGDILRDELKKETTTGIKYKKEIEKGEFLPTEVVQGLIENRILESILKKENIILDGFPRTLEQAYRLSAFMKTKDLEDNIYYVHIDVDPKKSVERILERRTCSSCNWIYNLKYYPPQIEDLCDRCKVPLTRRASDNLSDTNIRIETYGKYLESLVSHCKKQKKYISFDGNQSITKCIKRYIEFSKEN